MDKKRKYCSFRYPQGFKLDQKRQRVFLPKIGWVYYRKTLHLHGELRSVAVRRQNGRWFLSVSVATRSNVAVRRDPDRPIGADLGIACHTALSDGVRKKHPARCES